MLYSHIVNYMFRWGTIVLRHECFLKLKHEKKNLQCDRGFLHIDLATETDCSAMRSADNSCPTASQFSSMSLRVCLLTDRWRCLKLVKDLIIVRISRSLETIFAYLRALRKTHRMPFAFSWFIRNSKGCSSRLRQKQHRLSYIVTHRLKSQWKTPKANKSPLWCLCQTIAGIYSRSVSVKGAQSVRAVENFPAKILSMC